MGTTHATHISWDCILKKKKKNPDSFHLTPLPCLGCCHHTHGPRWQTEHQSLYLGQGTWKKSMTFKEQSWKLTPYIFTYFSLISAESHGHIWLQRKLGNTVFILDGHTPNQCLMDLLNKIGRKNEYQNG